MTEYLDLHYFLWKHFTIRYWSVSTLYSKEWRTLELQRCIRKVVITVWCRKSIQCLLNVRFSSRLLQVLKCDWISNESTHHYVMSADTTWCHRSLWFSVGRSSLIGLICNLPNQRYDLKLSSLLTFSFRDINLEFLLHDLFCYVKT